ncbi:MAG: hypothetical protein NVSMB4_10070 [Acidimicrobiales bacterium]
MVGAPFGGVPGDGSLMRVVSVTVVTALATGVSPITGTFPAPVSQIRRIFPAHGEGTAPSYD